MKTVALNELCEINVGRTPARNNAAFWGQGQPWLAIADMNQGRVVRRTKEQITPIAASSGKLVEPGTVLLSFKLSIGKVAVADIPLYTNEAIAALPIRDPDRICPQYLLRALEAMDLASGANRAAMGATLNKAKLQQLHIPLPPLPEQRRIAAILDQADALRAKSREIVKSVNQLAQSIFVDSFGEPSANPRDYPRAILGDVIRSASDGPHVSPQYAAEGIPFLSTRHVKPGRIVWEDLKFLSPSDAAVQWRKCRPTRGDILYTKGGTTGIAAAVNDDREFAVWVHVAVLAPLADRVNSTWLEAMLNTAHCYRQSQRLTHGIANRDLGLKRMVNIEILLPPIEEQNRYAGDVAEVRTTAYRSTVQVSKSEQLFTTLQSRAFRGEL